MASERLRATLAFLQRPSDGRQEIRHPDMAYAVMPEQSPTAGPKAGASCLTPAVVCLLLLEGEAERSRSQTNKGGGASKIAVQQQAAFQLMKKGLPIEHLHRSDQTVKSVSQRPRRWGSDQLPINSLLLSCTGSR